MIQHARDVRPRRQERLERPFDRLLQPPPVDFVLHARRERHLAKRPREMPVLRAGLRVADDLDVARVAAAEAEVVRQADVLDRERIHPHQLCRHRVDRNLIIAREDHVLHVRHHAAGTRSVAGERTVHHGEDPAVDRLLDHQQVDQRLVDHRVRPMPVLVEQAAEGVLHGAGGRGEDVGLHRRQMDDVLTDEAARNREPLRDRPR